MKKLAMISLSALAVLCTPSLRGKADDGPPARGAHASSAPRWYQRYRPDLHTAPSAAEATANPTPTLNLIAGGVGYHGGAVMQGYKAYTIFWAPAAHSIPSNYQALINRWFDDVGGSSLLNIATQYFQFAPPTYPFANVQNVSSLGATWLDSFNPYPHAGSAADPLLDSDIQAEVQRAITTNAWPNGGTDVEYLVYTASGIESCFTAAKTSCTPGVPGVSADQQYLGYHDFFGASHTTIYANLPYAATWVSLGNFISPNGVPAADLEIDVTSHEQFESMTDPTLSAWSSDADGEEIADRCVGTTGALAADGSNVTLNGHPYFVQSEWSNAQAGCALGLLCSTQPKTGCKIPTKSRASLLQLKISAAAKKNALTWNWKKGAATSLADFGDPLTTTTYGLCVYDEIDGNPILLMDVVAPAGSGWAKTATGFKYTNKTPTGNELQRVTLHAAGAGRAQITMSGKGAGLPMPILPLMQTPKVIVQLQNSAGVCWGADYSTATTNSSTQFKAKSD